MYRFILDKIVGSQANLILQVEATEEWETILAAYNADRKSSKTMAPESALN